MIVSIDKQLGNPVSSYLLHKSSSLIHILYDSWIFAKIPVGLLKLKGPFAFYYCLFCVPCWCYCYFQYFRFRVMLMIFNFSLCSPSSSHHNPFHRPSFGKLEVQKVFWLSCSVRKPVLLWSSHKLDLTILSMFTLFNIWCLSHIQYKIASTFGRLARQD